MSFVEARINSIMSLHSACVTTLVRTRSKTGKIHHQLCFSLYLKNYLIDYEMHFGMNLDYKKSHLSISMIFEESVTMIIALIEAEYICID
jgi:hypothetical protein